MTMDKYIHELFQKLENGLIEPFEEDILKTWIESNTENGTKYEQYMKADWQKLSMTMQKDNKPTKTRILKLNKWVAVAASFFAIVALSFLFLNRAKKIEVYAANSVKEVILPDQSVVTLNKYSTLVYDSKFGKSNRDMELSGSAYFDVAKNKDLPFMIQTTSAMTRVVGTAFYLEENEQDSLIKLDVDEGIVAIQVEDNPSVTKRIGERYSFNKLTGTISNYSIPTNDKYWKTKKLVFENTPLKEAIADISKAYGIKLRCKNDISKCKLTSTFEDEKIEDLLDVLAITYQGSWTEIEENTYELTNINCK